MRLATLVRRLGEANTFVEVSRVVCDYVRACLDGQQTSSHLCSSCTDLLAPTAPFAMSVDDIPLPGDDPVRLVTIAACRIDPDLREMAVHHGATGGDSTSFRRLCESARRNGYTGPMLYARCLPLVGQEGLIGTLRSGHPAPISRALSRDLDVMSAYASIRLARLGVAAVDDRKACSLAPRQREVAELAARGLTNREIGDAVGSSINTVKKQLKTVFARLDVSNRTELASLLARSAPRDDFPPGVSRVGNVWVAKHMLARG